MNKWEEVAKLFDLELYEKFKIDMGKGASIAEFWFTKYGLECDEVADFDTILAGLIGGSIEVVKFPWKPKEGKRYYFVFSRKSTFDVDYDCWENNAHDYTYWKVGNCFKTEEEAKEKGVPLIKKIIEEYEQE